VTYFGDGAVNIGSVLETMNLAAVWKFVIIILRLVVQGLNFGRSESETLCVRH